MQNPIRLQAQPARAFQPKPEPPGPAPLSPEIQRPVGGAGGLAHVPVRNG
jgi:hypothetical protein